MEVNHNSEKSQFEVKKEPQLAVLEYKMHRGTMYLMHTKVPEALSGEGIGSQLAKSALEYAKSEKLPILIYCSFIRDYVEKNPQYQPLIARESDQENVEAK